MPRWQDAVAKHIEGDTDISGLTLLHNGESIGLFATRSARGLLEHLGQLHTHYAYLQNKPHAISVKSFALRQPGPRLPSLTAEFNGGRWGLHGYRLNASVNLYESAKYAS